MAKEESVLNYLDIEGVSGNVQSNGSRISSWKKEGYGMFIHWGLYSALGGVWNGQPVTKGYSEQIKMWADIPGKDYLEVAKDFSADSFDPVEIVSLAKKAGMNYIVMTTKHHDGFCMFDTETTDYNIVEKTPYGKDAIKLMAEECERQGLRFGLYYSLIDWYMGHEFKEENNNAIPLNIEEIIEKQLTELMTNYGSIFELWFDMSSPTVEQSQKFIDIVHKYQPQTVINSRIWNNMGDFRTLADNEVPSVRIKEAFQIPASIYNETWGYRKWQVRKDLKGKVKELLNGLLGGGNYLLNIGPRGDGSIVEFEKDVLELMGQWIHRHPELVKKSYNMEFDPQDWGRIRIYDKHLYLVLAEKPESKELTIEGLLNAVDRVTEDGTDHDIKWRREGSQLIIDLPEVFEEEILPVIKIKLEDAAEFLPKRTIHLMGTAEQKMKSDDLYYGYGYSDSGNYDTLQQTVVEYKSYLLSKQEKEYRLQLTGDAHLEKNYEVQIGNKSYTANGEELTSGVLASFKLAKNKITPLTIQLKEAEHAGEALEFDVDSIILSEK
ncbi:MAG: alpha-L-fucosidase [Atopostipes sp.]|nr:alpha-L-fucosidase [Atopostipes sp.]